MSKMSEKPQQPYAPEYSAPLDELQVEMGKLPEEFPHARAYLKQEIERIQSGSKYTVIHQPKSTKMSEKIRIPIKEYPKFNFVGKLLGPKGSTLKSLQEETNTKMSILGKGSMRERSKEEQMRKEGGLKYAHLNDDLHLLVEVFGLPVDCHQRLSHACAELERYLNPDNGDDIRQEQMQIQQMYTEANGGDAGRGRGRGRGAPGPFRGRGGPLLNPPRGGGAGPPPSMGRGGMRGAPRGRGMPSRGGAAPPQARQPPQHADPMSYEQDYNAYDNHTSVQNTGYDEAGYGDEYGGEESYDTGTDGYGQSSYGGSAGSGGAGDTQYYDYSHSSRGTTQSLHQKQTGYDDYEPKQESWSNAQAGYGKAAAPTRGGRTDYRSHPYGSNPAPRGTASRGPVSRGAMPRSTPRY